MSRMAFFVLVISLCLCPAALAADNPLPICAGDEFLEAFHQVVEHQVLFDNEVATYEELVRVSEIALATRHDLAQLPACSEAIVIERLLTALGGDALARAALRLAGAPDAENPYLIGLPADQARIEDQLAAMLAIDRSAALPAERRELPACQAEDWSLLDVAASSLLLLAQATPGGADPAESLSAIDQLLRWREDNLGALPECAESIDLLQAISEAATDAAADQAFKYGSMPAGLSPFPPLLQTSLAAIRDWRDLHSLKAASEAASPKAADPGLSQLPACADADAIAAFMDSQSEYAALIEAAVRADSIASLVAFANEQFDFRKARLLPLPHCVEAFALRWWTAEALADAALRSAIVAGAPASIAPDIHPAFAENEARASASWARLEDRLSRGDRALDGSMTAAAPECRDSDHVFLFTYLVPEFWKLTDFAMSISLPQAVPAFIERSYAFRELLWAHLPRCDAALEMGLLMRSAAADAAAMLALELAGAQAWDIPYLPQVAGDIDRFFALAGEFITPCGNLTGDTKTYYVVAENIANIRACASTNCEILTTATRGQQLDVADDMSNWYKIVLPNCETAFIAGFLASQTPPAR